MSRQPGGWGIYCFWYSSYLLFLVRIPSALASAFISVHYLLNQLMDIDTLLGEKEDLIRFGHSGTLKCLKYGFCGLSSELVDPF